MNSRSHRWSTRRATSGRVMNISEPSPSKLRAMESLFRRGPLTLVFVFSPSCPHCHTYMPLWKELCSLKSKKSNMVSMRADTYQQTPMAAQKEVTGVPSVLYVDTEGRVSEANDIRNRAMMTNVVKTGSPNPQAQAPAPSPMKIMSQQQQQQQPAPSPMKMTPTAPPATPIAGTEVRGNPLQPLPALPVRQWGGSPWAAFLAAARQAAPAAALLGAYAALPRRSSGLPRARRTRRLRRSRRRV